MATATTIPTQIPTEAPTTVKRPTFADLQANLEARLQRKLRARGDGFLPGNCYLQQWGHEVDATGTVPYTDEACRDS